MKQRILRWTLLVGPFLLTMPLFQTCVINVPPGIFIDGFPHLDGDGADSPLDNFFGFDDDDD